MSASRLHILAICIVSILVAGAFLVSLIRRNHRKQIDPASLLALAPMGGILTLIFLALVTFLLSAGRGRAVDFRAVFAMLALILIAATALLNVRRSPPAAGSPGSLLALLLLLCGLAVARLAFIHDLVMPAYSDSVEHYQIISDLLHPERPAHAFYSLTRIASRYYHFGFHALSGWMSALSAAPVQEVMLVLGQILQAVIPVSLFFLIRRITQSDAGGLSAVLLAGLAWRMPAYASNWGKYPALTSLAVFPFTLGMLSLAGSAADRKERLSLTAIALAGAIVSTLSHTRGLLLLLMALGAWWAAGRLLNAGRVWAVGALAAAAALAAWMTLRVAAEAELSFMLAPYTREGLPAVLLATLLVPYGLKHQTRPMLSALLFLLAVLAGALVPLPDTLSRYGYQTLLDRPFVQMTLFLPLCCVGGVGFAGLAAEMRARLAAPASAASMRALWTSACVLMTVALGIQSWRVYGFSPSTCCRLAGQDDLAAFEWMRANLTEEAVILIAANRTPTRSFGVDGGIWITPLTGYRTEKWPFNASMNSAAQLEQICAKGVTHIYAGGTAARFPVEQMESQPARYENLFTRPGAYLYKLRACEPID